MDSNTTKPDWSDQEYGLLVELKYVRKVRGLSEIRSDIAEDNTKYGDDNRPVLFIVYDPDHVIIDEESFRGPVNQRENPPKG